MRRIGSEIAAGVAIFLAFIIFVVGFLFLKNIALNTGKYNVTVRFSDVTGLERSDQVSVSGLKIGKVKSFVLDGLNVLATVELEPDVILPKDSRAEIKSLGMVGEKFIDIIPGVAPERLTDGDVIAGKPASDLSQITSSMEGLMEQAETLLAKAQNIFDNVLDDKTQHDFKESLHHIRNLASSLDKNTEELSRTMTNVDQLSQNLNEILAERRAKVETSIDNFYAASNQLDGLAKKVDQSLTSVQTLLDKIENQEGSVGKVIARDELYNDFRHLTTELDALVQDLKKRPQKYLNLGFIKVF